MTESILVSFKYFLLDKELCGFGWKWKNFDSWSNTFKASWSKCR